MWKKALGGPAGGAGSSTELSEAQDPDSDASPFKGSYNPNFGGVLVQKKVFNHWEIASRVGNTLSTIRMIIIVDARGRPDVAAAFWKVALEKNSTDNFARGAHGNLLADVDLSSGEVGRVCGGLWPTHQSKQNHPETQAQLSGFVLPHWDLAKTTVMRAALEFPGLRLQGWDVGITDEGPLLLEVNTEISLEYVQLLTGRPFFSDTDDATWRT